MYKWFVKWFIKNKDDTNSASIRSQYGSLAGGFGIITNLLLSAIKITVGLLSGSVSILAEGIDNLSDSGSSIITIMGFRMSKAPADEEHPFGHQRIEYITGILVSFIIMAVALLMGYRSILRIINPVVLEISYWTIIILGITIIIKLYQGGFYVYLSKKIKSQTLKATSTDSFNDCIRTFAVIIGVLIYLISNQKYNLDGYLGIIVSIYILITGVQLLKETSTPLIGTSPDPTLIKRLEERFTSYEGTIGFHDLIVHSYGPNRIYATVHIEVPSSVDIMESHELIDKIERDVAKFEGINLVIHMDPVDQNDEVTNQLHQGIKELITKYDNRLSIHDFRVVKMSDHKNIIFDVVCPPQYQLTPKELKNQIKTLIKAYDDTLTPIIQIDQFYVHSKQKEDKMLEVGAKVSNFTLFNQFNEQVSLSDFQGKKKVIYFYPKDDTPGCTVQACTFGDHIAKFKEIDCVIIGISKDSVESHEKFVKKYQLPFILLADTDLNVINQFGVYQEKVMYGKKTMGVRRSTFILDENDNVIKVFPDAKPDTNALDVLDFLVEATK